MEIGEMGAHPADTIDTQLQNLLNSYVNIVLTSVGSLVLMSLVPSLSYQTRRVILLGDALVPCSSGGHGGTLLHCAAVLSTYITRVETPSVHCSLTDICSFL